MSDKDVDQFNARAGRYDRDFLGRNYHRRVHEALVNVVAGLGQEPRAILDVGCGTGSALALLGARFPRAGLSGVDPAPEMLRVARDRLGSSRAVDLQEAHAESLPFGDNAFDLVVSSNSFHHWADQAAGIREIGRVLAPGGHLVMTDPFAVGFRRWIRAMPWFGRLRTAAEVEAMLSAAGLERVAWRSARVGFVSSHFLIARPG